MCWISPRCVILPAPRVLCEGFSMDGVQPHSSGEQMGLSPTADGAAWAARHRVEFESPPLALSLSQLMGALLCTLTSSLHPESSALSWQRVGQGWKSATVPHGVEILTFGRWGN